MRQSFENYRLKYLNVTAWLYVNDRGSQGFC